MEAFVEFLRALDLRGLSEIAITLRFVCAVLCGGLIGLEREHKHRPAGFRTHILVCVGSALTTMTGQYLLTLSKINPDHFVSDPARLGAQVIAGIGFIGAGTIVVTKRRQVKGLTTAAGLWVSAIVGLAIGVGYYEAALYTTFLILMVEIFLSRLDWFLISNVKNINVYVEYTEAENLTAVLHKLKEEDIKILDVEITKNKLDTEKLHISAVLVLKLTKKTDNNRVLETISGIDGVRAVEEL